MIEKKTVEKMFLCFGTKVKLKPMLWGLYELNKIIQFRLVEFQANGNLILVFISYLVNVYLSSTKNS